MRIGPYEIVEKIGEGGAGLVFRARGADGRDVALKVLRRASGASRFEREVRLLAELGEGHGFVPLVDQGESSQGPYLVMPFLGGGTLRARLETPMDPDEALELGLFLAETLGRAHAKGIVHRDLKPENILYTGDGRPLVADLGVAKHFDRDATGGSQSVSLSRAGEMRGTAGYMAPEQMKDSTQVGPPADVFAIGAILYECLSGAPAFSADNVIALFEKVESGRHVPLGSARRDTPTYLAAVIERALSVDPEERYPDGLALHQALARPPAAPRRRGAELVVGALVVAALAVTVAAVTVIAGPGTAAGVGPVTSDAATRPVTSVTRATEPAWFLALPERERPRGKGVKPTATPGEWRNEKDGTILLRVPGGECRLGLGEKARHVSLSSFFISKYEVTNAQFEKFVAETRHVTSVEESGAGLVDKKPDDDNNVMSGYDTKPGVTWRNPDLQGKPRPDEPVLQVSWDDAAAYCKWAGLVLPTQEQWEKAAAWDPRERRARIFPWGDGRPAPGSPAYANLTDRAFFKKYRGRSENLYEDGVADRAPVGTFPLDRSPCGALDMGGNASEWCRDDLGGKELSVTLRPFRGGNWCSTRSFAVAGSPIDPIPAHSGTTWIGIRPALER